MTFIEEDIPCNHHSGKNVLAPKTTGDGIENARFLGSRIWHEMPSSINESQIL